MMKGLFYGFYFTFLLTMILSCSDKKTNTNRALSKAPINIVLENIKTETSFLYDSITNYHLIHLQTTDNCAIGKVDKVMICRNNIIVFDKRQKTVFIFDEKGNFLSKINDIGRGPNQYIQINDFCVSEETNSIFTLVASGGFKSKVFEYDFEGIIKNNFSLPYSSSKIGYFNKNLTVYSDFQTSDSKNFNIHITTRNGDIISKFFPYKRRKGGWSMDLNTFLNFKDQLYYYPVYSDTIYRFSDSNTIEPYIVLKEKEKTNTQMLNEQFQNISSDEFVILVQKSNYKNFLDLIISEKYLFFEQSSNGLEERFIYNLKNKKLYSFKDGDYLTSLVASPIFTDGNWLVNIFNPYEVHEFISQVKNKLSADNFIDFLDNNSFIKEVYEHSKPNDNPIIIKYTLE